MTQMPPNPPGQPGQPPGPPPGQPPGGPGQPPGPGGGAPPPPGGQPPGAPGPWDQQPPPPGGGGGSSRAPLIAVLVVVAVALVGGGAFLVLSDDGDDERDAYVEALAAGMDPETFPGEMSEDDTTCIAEAAVDVIGMDRLTEAATPEEIREDPDWELGGPDPTREQVEGIVDGMMGCVDLTSAIVDSMLAEPGMPAGAEDCVRDFMDDDLVRELMVAELMEESSTVNSTLRDEMTQCMVGGGGSTDGSGLGGSGLGG